VAAEIQHFGICYKTELIMEFGAHCAPNLTWSHYRLIIRLSDKNAMQYYLTEASESNCSVRTNDPFSVHVPVSANFSHITDHSVF